MDNCNSSVGTIAYMSPERINTDLNHDRYDGYVGDIWSLGVSILEFYLGKFPFAVKRHEDWASLMCAICMSQPLEAPATASLEFRNFTAYCLQRDPTKVIDDGDLIMVVEAAAVVVNEVAIAAADSSASVAVFQYLIDYVHCYTGFQ